MAKRVQHIVQTTAVATLFLGLKGELIVEEAAAFKLRVHDGATPGGFALVGQSSIDDHAAATSGVHGVTGNVVGTEGAQTLLTKTLQNATAVGIGMTAVNPLDITKTQDSPSSAKILNASAGNSAYAEWLIGNGTALAAIRLYGSGYTTAGIHRQNGFFVGANGAGGMSVGTTANQPLYFVVNDLEVGLFNSNGLGIGGNAFAQFPLNIERQQNNAQHIGFTNSSVGNAASANVFLAADGVNSDVSLTMYGAGFTTSGMAIAASARLNTRGAGGLSLGTESNTIVRIVVNNAKVAEFNGTGFASDKRVTSAVVVLTDGATVALDAALGNTFTLTAAGNRSIDPPTNAVSGQRIVIRHTASAADRTLALNTGAGGFRFGTDITAITVTPSGKTDYIGAIYNAASSTWDVVAYTKGF